MLADGGFVVLWNSQGSTGSDTSGYSVQARIFGEDGLPLTGELQVNTYTTGNQLSPHVAGDLNGNLVVVWDSQGSMGTDDDAASVQVRRFDRHGMPLDVAELQVNTFTSGSQGGQSVAVGRDGGFVVAWLSEGSLGSDSSYLSIQARRFGADGLALDAAEFQVNTYTTYRQFDPRVAAAPDGSFVVVWTSDGSFGNDNWSHSVQARRFAADGTPLDPVEFQVNAYTPYSQAGPGVAMAPDGGFVVAWTSDVTNGTDTHIGVQARRFAANAIPLDPEEFQVNVYTNTGQSGNSVAMNAEGDFVIAWETVRSAGVDQDGSSQARRYRAAGTPIDALEFQLNTFTTSWQLSPMLAAGPDGDFVAVWASRGSFGSDNDGTSVSARRFGRPTIAVTSNSGGTGGPGCTLRDAIAAANTGQAVGECPAGNEGAVVELPPGSAFALTEVDNGVNGLPVVERPVTIRGRSARIERDPGLACPAGREFRLFEVADGGVLTLEDVSVSNGCLSSGSGAGVFSDGGSLVLREASIEGNEAGAAGGGVSLVDGNLLSFDSSVRGNLAGAEGGGISVAGDPGWVLVDRTTLSENVALSGGGLSLAGTVSARIRNSTFSGNVAGASGGGIELAGAAASLVLDFSTVTGNSAPTGAGVHVAAGGLSLHGSLLGENATGADCASGAGVLSASGLNLDTDGSCAALAGANVTTVASLGLGALADHGGFGRTHLPLAGSAALDAAPACATASGAALFADARGYPRPTDDDGDAVPECELGAVERGPVFLDGFESANELRWSSFVEARRHPLRRR
jgi:hypothetical protein